MKYKYYISKWDNGMLYRESLNPQSCDFFIWTPNKPKFKEQWKWTKSLSNFLTKGESVDLKSWMPVSRDNARKLFPKAF